MNYTRDKRTLLAVYFLFYYGVFLFFYIDHRLLGQYQPIFFNYNRDLTELALIATGLPKWMIHHTWGFVAADMLALAAPLAVLGSYFRRGRFSLWGGVFFTVVFSGWLLLADIFWQVHLEPFILYFLLSLVFWTNSPERWYWLLRGCRYYFLYIFFSAAVWKLARGAVFAPFEMSRILLRQHADLLSGVCDGWQCRAIVDLIGHPGLSWSIYVLGVLVELAFAVGFFTRRWDRLLLGLAVLFVAADLVIMRIPYWTVLMGGVTLWPGRPRRLKSGIVVYETTHHENLPALLDLCEDSFDRVTVFLKPVSFSNLSGGESPGLRWPGVRFVVQDEGVSNREFIGRMFRLLRVERYTHLHLSTLDNNFLLLAVRLWLARGVHVSLTVHEVNEYFAYAFSSLRDWTESLAKVLLHRRIRHHTMFLPAMAGRFLERMPGAVAVFIPSRFYGTPAAPGIEGYPGAWGPGDGSPGHGDGPAAPGGGSPGHGAGFAAPGGGSPAVPRPFRVVVPGSVDANRRDYGEVLSFFEEWSSHSRPVELVILGNSDSEYGRALLGRLRRLESAGFRCFGYEGYIPEEEYERQIASADILWSPLRVNKKSSRNSPETYGQTTASGLTADLLLYHAPALTPIGFELPEAFRAAQLSYSSREELKIVFDRLVQDAGFAQGLQLRIHEAFCFFKKENFTGAFRSMTGLPPLPAASQEESQPG